MRFVSNNHGTKSYKSVRKGNVWIQLNWTVLPNRWLKQISRVQRLEFSLVETAWTFYMLQACMQGIFLNLENSANLGC